METKKIIETMFETGAQFGLGRSRRHPSVAKYIFGTKNNTDIFDLEKTESLLAKAKSYVSDLAKDGKVVLFVGGKKEAAESIKISAQSLNMPYVDSRWIGGALTNFAQIRRRIDKYEKFVSDREKGELAKYTKRERMLIDKEIASLEKMFYGIVSMKKMPDALFIIDPKHEKNAVKEAQDMNIPIIALSGSDCDISVIKYPIVANDNSKSSIRYFVEEISSAYQMGKKKNNA